MSLVLLSSTQEEFSRVGTRLSASSGSSNPGSAGLQQPWSFTNFLHEPLKIPANSEVAVASVKIKRSPFFNINENSEFYFYFGKNLITVQAGVGAARVPQIVDNLYEASSSTPVGIKMPIGYYNKTTFTEVLQTALNTQTGNPFIWNRNTVDVSDVTDGGFTFDIAQNGLFDVNWNQIENWNNDNYPFTAVTDERHLVPADARSVTDAAGVSTDNFVWRETGVANPEELQRTVAGTGSLNSCSVICRYAPLQTRGEFEVEVGGRTASAGAGNNWSVGLTRPTCWDRTNYDSSNGSQRRTAPPYWDDDAVFKDFAVEQRFVNGVNTLFLTHAVWENGVYRQRDIQYWGTGNMGLPAAQFDATNYADPGAGVIDTVKFTVTGETLRVEYSINANPGVFILITDSASFPTGATTDFTASKGRTFKKVNQNCIALYPIFQIQANAGVMRVINWWSSGANVPAGEEELGEVWDGGKAYNFNYPRAEWENRMDTISGAGYGGQNLTAGASWWGRCATNPDIMVQGQELDSRQDQVMDDGIAIKYDYVGLDTNNEAINYDYILCLQPTGTMSTRVAGAYVNNGIGTSQMLGFDELSSVSCATSGVNYDVGENVNATARYTWQVNSTDEAEMDVNTLLVNSSSLTHQSYNMAKSTMSKILWHMPRFDNAGRQHGNLYLEPSERVYLKLHNTEELSINNISIELTDKTQREAKDLRGDTTLTLHFRDAK